MSNNCRLGLLLALIALGTIVGCTPRFQRKTPVETTAANTTISPNVTAAPPSVTAPGEWFFPTTTTVSQGDWEAAFEHHSPEMSETELLRAAVSRLQRDMARFQEDLGRFQRDLEQATDR